MRWIEASIETHSSDIDDLTARDDRDRRAHGIVPGEHVIDDLLALLVRIRVGAGAFSRALRGQGNGRQRSQNKCKQAFLLHAGIVTYFCKVVTGRGTPGGRQGDARGTLSPWTPWQEPEVPAPPGMDSERCCSSARPRVYLRDCVVRGRERQGTPSPWIPRQEPEVPAPPGLGFRFTGFSAIRRQAPRPARPEQRTGRAMPGRSLRSADRHGKAPLRRSMPP